MTTTPTETPVALSHEQIAEMLDLLKDSDSVELKLTVPEHDQRSAVVALGLDPLEAQIRQVFFFETPDLALDQNGVVVRARRSQKKGDDTVVKLRPVVPAELPKALRRSPNFGVELDASPEGYVVSGSLKGAPTSGDVRDAMLGKRAVRKLFSKEQQELFAEHAPAGSALDDLRMLGPLLVLKLKSTPERFDRKLVVEMWLYPDGSRILELSTKCAPGEGLQVAGEMRAFLAERGIPTTGDQQTKTRTALEHFAAHLDAEAS